MPGQQTTAELLQKLQTTSSGPATAVKEAAAAPPTTDELLKQLMGTVTPKPPDVLAPPKAATAKPPAAPKSVRQQINEFDAQKSWPELLAVSFNKGLISPLSSLFTSDLKDKQDNLIGTAKFNVLQKPSTHSITDMMKNAMRFAGMAMPGSNVQGLLELGADKLTPSTTVNTASTVAELGGTAVSSIPFQQGANQVTGLNKALSLAKDSKLPEKIIRNLYADTVSGATMSGFAKLEPGESRAALIGKNAVISGVTGMLAAPLFLRSWKEELGVEASNHITNVIARDLGLTEELAQAKVTALRSGASQDLRTAESVIKAATQDPRLEHSPLVAQAQKRLELTFGHLLPRKPPIIDQSLKFNDPNYGISLNVYIDGVPKPIKISSKANDHKAFFQGVNKLRYRLVELADQGHDIKMDDFLMHSEGTWSRFRNIMLGVDRKGNIVVDPKDIPGAAPRGTVAEIGVDPRVGDRVRVDGDSKGQTREGTVVQRPETPITEAAAASRASSVGTGAKGTSSAEKISDATADEMRKRLEVPEGPFDLAEEKAKDLEVLRKARGEMEAKGTLPPRVTEVEGRPATQPRRTPTSELSEEELDAKYRSSFTVPMENSTGAIEHVPKDRLRYVVQVGQPQRTLQLQAQPDGDARRFIVHNAQQDMSVEAHGAPSENNYFRSTAFDEINSQADLGHDTHGYIHADGSITFSVPQVQRYTTETQYGQRSEGGPMDTVAGRRPGLHTEEYPGTEPRPTTTVSGGGKGRTIYGRREGLPSQGEARTNPPETSPLQVSRIIDPATGKTVGFKHHATPPDMRMYETDPTTKVVGGAKVVHEYVSPLSFGAGYTPRKMRPSQFELPKWVGSRSQVASPVETTERATAREVKNIQLVKVGGEVTAQARGTGAGLTHVDTPQYRVPASTKKNPRVVKPRELYLGKNTAADVPEMITARDSARIMLKRGIDPGTKVRVRASEFVHSANELIEPEWTLRELAQFEPHMVPLDALRSEASRRGFTFIPDGTGGILRDTETGAEKYFQYQLEAAEHLGRIPESPIGPIIEDPIEKAFKMGWYRSFDAEVDSARFLGVDAQELAMKELVEGKRPLVHVWSSDPEALTDTIRSIETSRGLAPGTLRIMELDPTLVGYGTGKGLPFAIYEPNAVNRIRVGMTAGLKIDPESPFAKLAADTPEGFISKLQTVPAGLDALKGRDPESALVYSFLRHHRMKDEWEMGKVAQDTLGTYRVYDPEMKRALFARIQGESGKGEPSDHSLDDFIKWDPEVEFSPHSTKEPGIIEPLDDVPLGDAPPDAFDPIAATGFPEAPPKKLDFPASPFYGIRIPTELYKQIEARTGVPFWTSWKVLQDARAEVETVLASPYQILNSWKGNYDKSVREQAQIIFESRLAGKPLDDLIKGSHVDAPKAADQLEQAWRTFLGEEGFSDVEMREFFAEFPKLRKLGGDYKSYAESRSGLPKMMKMLNRDFMNGEIRITDRELDGFTLGRRIMRMVAQEKHMMDKWNLVEAQMNAYKMSDPGIPEDLFDHFKVHMKNMRHTPDVYAVAINRSIEKIFQKLGIKALDREHIGDFTSFILGLNYNANMAWRPGLVLRNMMQTIQTTYPIAGEKYTGKAISYGIRWLKDPKLQEEMIQRGIIPRDALSQSFGDIQDLVLNAEAGGKGSLLSRGVVAFLRKGTSWYKTTDDFNRVVAYQAQYLRAMDEGKKLMSGKISKDKFNITSKLDLQDAENGPLTQLVHKLIEKGDLSAAAHAIADNFQGMTQFRYDRANAAKILSSTPGRIFGQYGTWSANYLEFGRSVASRGSWENRLKTVGRWVGANTAVYYAAQEVFGVDAARWVGFSPLAYSGGPVMNIASQASSAATMALQGQVDLEKTWDAGTIVGDKGVDQVTRAQAGKLSNAYQQFVPGFGVGRDIYRATQEEEFGEAIKRFLNMPSTTKKRAQPMGSMPE